MAIIVSKNGKGAVCRSWAIDERIANVILVGFVFLALSTSVVAQESVDVPKKKPAMISSVVDHLLNIRQYLDDRKENKKATKAVDAEREKIPLGETRTFEVVSVGGPLMAGGKFVRVQEAKPGPKISAQGEYTSAPFTIGGGLPLPANKLTPAQKEEMQRKAEIQIREEKTLKEAQEAEKKLQEIRSLAEKTRAELEAAQLAASQAALIAKNAATERARVAKAEAAAAKAERDAERNGRELQREINRERERYKKAGGNFRMPAGN